jgi:hypothetical protein
MAGTGTNPASSPERNCLRQVERWPVLIPCIRHARLGDERGVRLCASTRSFYSAVHWRRHSGPLRTGPRSFEGLYEYFEAHPYRFADTSPIRPPLKPSGQHAR